MLLYAPFNYDSVTGFIDLLGVVEPDQVVGGVLIGVLHGVIQTTFSQGTTSVLGSDWTNFISRASLGSSGNLSVIGQS